MVRPLEWLQQRQRFSKVLCGPTNTPSRIYSTSRSTNFAKISSDYNLILAQTQARARDRHPQCLCRKAPDASIYLARSMSA